MSQIVSFNCEHHFPADFPPTARDLVTRLMRVDPSKRLGASGMDAVKVRDARWSAACWEAQCGLVRCGVVRRSMHFSMVWT